MESDVSKRPGRREVSTHISGSRSASRRGIVGALPKRVPAVYGVGDVEHVISSGAAKFSQHPFLKRLESTGTIENIHVMARCVTFYVFCFQDMLRLVRERISDPRLKEVARTHELEDKGHDKWFLADLQRFG